MSSPDQSSQHREHSADRMLIEAIVMALLEEQVITLHRHGLITDEALTKRLNANRIISYTDEQLAQLPPEVVHLMYLLRAIDKGAFSRYVQQYSHRVTVLLCWALAGFMLGIMPKQDEARGGDREE